MEGVLDDSDFPIEQRVRLPGRFGEPVVPGDVDLKMPPAPDDIRADQKGAM